MTLSQRKYERERQRRRAQRRRDAELCVRCGLDEREAPRKPDVDHCIACVAYQFTRKNMKKAAPV